MNLALETHFFNDAYRTLENNALYVETRMVEYTERSVCVVVAQVHVAKVRWFSVSPRVR